MIQRCLFIVLLFLGSQAIAQQLPRENFLKRKAPESFRVLFKTTQGNFIMEVYRRWSPAGADRIYQLVKSGFYNNTYFFRVEHNYVVQFGIADQPELNIFWDSHKLRDEPLLQKHTRGTVAFARDVANSRATQLFINTVNNPTLDTTLRAGVRGFTPVARIIEGMQVIDKLNGEYGRNIVPVQDSIYKYGNLFLDVEYPGLDRIISAKIFR